MATQEEYNTYIESDEWKERCRRFIKEVGECEECSSKENLTCHHIKYKNLGKEEREDVEVLCEECHKDKHKYDKYKKRLRKRFVGGQDPSLDKLKEEAKELADLEEKDPDAFWHKQKIRKRKSQWKPDYSGTH